MITIVLTNRNRSLSLISKCFASLRGQNNQNFKCIVVDYGSNPQNQKLLQSEINKHANFELILCSTQKQLWCKSRAINLALKQCDTTYFFVGDIDMIYHPHFIEELHILKDKHKVVYFKVGFLSENESNTDKDFEDYQIAFPSNEEATGMTLYKTEILKSINGYDEFYHGWGAEDTDVHVRLENANIEVAYFDREILMLHQWHPKAYRGKDSFEPFHFKLESINHKYLEFTRKTKKVVANTNFEWGHYNASDYSVLEAPQQEFLITNELADVKGFIHNMFLDHAHQVISVKIKEHSEYNSLKQTAKKLIHKKTKEFLPLEEVNDLLLEAIIADKRNAAYSYRYSVQKNEITLVIKL
ncbi:glycosyltransferase family 2 protein [Hyunsoonleella rubra]|uniref:Glycosyltransferase family 2 protein n=1 Tax=Hyunsoonleella rubra TaxID=1737062 RepID=A0ABW5TFT5_9FLAO